MKTDRGRFPMKRVSTQRAPKAIGPYSQAIEANGMIFTSGQIALTAEGKLAGETIEVQTRQVLQNLSEVLAAAGASLDDVLKTTVFLSDMEDFAKMNEIYAQYFKQNAPARSTVAVKTLPLDVKVEIECIALKR
jgi:2-iminobutanoate/2-iminopropanoate deaminase